METVQYVGLDLPEILTIDQLYTIHYYELDKEYCFRGEEHDFWELLYVDKGVAEIWGGNKRYTLQQGEVVFHKPLEYHNIAANGQIAPNIAIISFSSHSPVMSAFNEKIIKLDDKCSHTLSKIISLSDKLLDINIYLPDYTPLTFKREVKPYEMQLLKELIEQFLLSLLSIRENSPIRNRIIRSNYDKYEKSILRRIQEVLIDNIYGHVTLEQLSRIVNMSPAHLCTIFKENTGMSIIAYFNQMKIQEAKRLMREEPYTVTQVAQMLGFSTIHYFSRVFKDIANMSPSEYLKSIWSKGQED